MTGNQCDTCRQFAPGPLPDGWFVLLRQEAAEVSLAAVLRGRGGAVGGAELSGTFCSVRCLAEYAYVALAAEGAQDTAGTEG